MTNWFSVACGIAASPHDTDHDADETDEDVEHRRERDEHYDLSDIDEQPED